MCGDVHGQYYDVLNLFSLNGVPSPTQPLSLQWDFVDEAPSAWRSSSSSSLQAALPQHFHLTRGNHESLNMNSIYGFQGRGQR